MVITTSPGISDLYPPPVCHSRRESAFDLAIACSTLRNLANSANFASRQLLLHNAYPHFTTVVITSSESEL